MFGKTFGTTLVLKLLYLKHNMIDGASLLFNVTANMRECLIKLLNLLYPHKIKTIAYGDMISLLYLVALCTPRWA